MFKKLIITLAFLLALTSVSVLGADKYKGYELPVVIDINGNFIKCDQKPFLENGVTYIPLRAFAYALSSPVYWDGNTQTAIMVKDNHSLKFCVTDNYCTVDGVQKPCSVIVRQGLMFVPVRILSEALGYGVSWDNSYMTVKITAPDVAVQPNYVDYSYTYEDILYLAKITMLESGTGSLDMKIAICNTILNRVKSSQFPNTIKGVIFDTNYGTQFPPAHTDKINKTPSLECFIAAKCALNGVNLAGNSLYFISTKAAPKSWAHKNRTFYKTIGSTNFYL